MGQKVNPIGLRLGINRTWDSRWYSGRREYGQLLHEDMKIREYLREQLKQAGISKILIERADGARRTVLVHAHPLRGDSGEILGAMNVLIDITQRQRDQVSLRESEERFARFMDHLPGLAWIKDLDGRYVFANNAALKAFGRSREDLHGKLDSEIFPPQVVAQDRDSDRNGDPPVLP